MSEDFATIVDAFIYAVKNTGDAKALIFEDKELTYHQYGKNATGIAAELASIGVKKGDRVAISAATSADVPQLIFGILTAGGQVVMINPLYTAREVEPLLDISEPKYIFCDSSAIEVGAALAAGKNIGLIDISQGLDSWLDTPENKLPIEFPADLPKAEDPALILFTGGTTGISKGVPHTHAEIIAAMEISDQTWPFEPESEIVLNVPPLFHIVGHYHGVYQTVYRRVAVIFLPRFHPDEVFEAFKNHPITVFIIGVATAYSALMKHPEFDKVDFSGVKYCAGGGAPLAVKTREEWESRTGVPALEGYGMTEGAPYCSNSFRKPGKDLSAGRILDGVELQIVDVETGNTELPTGESGEIRVRGPHVTKGYLNDKEATETAFRESWLYTGDIAYKDQDGFIFIVDRSKDMALVSGFNVFPREIDEVLIAHPKILEAAVVGIPDDYRGEIIKAYVVVRDGETLDEAGILDYCGDNLVKYKVPTVVEFLDALPKTPVGKIDKKQLKN